jgi:hypothetical protein
LVLLVLLFLFRVAFAKREAPCATQYAAHSLQYSTLLAHSTELQCCPEQRSLAALSRAYRCESSQLLVLTEDDRTGKSGERVDDGGSGGTMLCMLLRMLLRREPGKFRVGLKQPVQQVCHRYAQLLGLVRE